MALASNPPGPLVFLTGAGLAYPGGFQPVEALDEITLSLGGQTLTAIMGPSGCGKTTLLELIAGLRAPTRGTIERPAALGSAIGYVFQSPALLPWRRLLDNCMLGAEIVGGEATARAKLPDLLERYGLLGFEQRFPRELSGGMQQRVAMIRAVLAGARLLLLDEPFSDSDPRLRLDLQRDLARLVDDEGMTAVLVTHDVDEALRLADRVVLLSPRPGTVQEIFDVREPRRERLDHPHRLPDSLEDTRVRLLDALHTPGRPGSSLLAAPPP